MMMIPERFRERLDRARENAKKGIIYDSDLVKGLLLAYALTDEEAEQIRKELEAASIKLPD
ncbi:MAG: hypothetical protein BLM47_01465 [Candidatus Reconcilbacillus cellulovorans]|uniref:Uncharacterized protein n=1 Tax=Candidatus Reconcilbacillus cellulovorans TaxID=1906605 RepID=A0A2A6E349_9BACL|nr:MAG: hypothetical protein BLM47_01465 [Candidatus Reconcilbacillus cellulovorans]